MAYNFFAYLSRLKYIERWSLMRNVSKENVLEHTAQVAQLAHCLALINNKVFGGVADANKAAVIALYHETGEVITGDLPTPVKYFNEDTKNAYKGLEKVANEKLLAMLPSFLQGEFSAIVNCGEGLEYRLVKAADKLAAYIKCLEEVKSGNNEFTKALKATERALEETNLPEVKYFMENFIKGFSLTLDELDN